MEVIKIGNQTWMIQNINLDTFQNGDIIQEAKTEEEWVNAGKNKEPAWCYYDNDPANGEEFGKLYNWYAITDKRGLAPKGTQIPTFQQFKELSNFLGGDKISGKVLKTSEGWKDNGNGNNEIGFTAKPAGDRDDIGRFSGIGSSAMWWSSSEETDHMTNERNMGMGKKNKLIAISLNLSYYNTFAVFFDTFKSNGFSVRCILK